MKGQGFGRACVSHGLLEGEQMCHPSCLHEIVLISVMPCFRAKSLTMCLSISEMTTLYGQIMPFLAALANESVWARTP